MGKLIVLKVWKRRRLFRLWRFELCILIKTEI